MTAVSIFLAAALAACAQAAEPFRMPVGARVNSGSPDGRGWCVSGEMDVTFVQSVVRLRSAAEAAGWRFLHETPVGRKGVRTLMAFARGDSELTVMVTRLGVSKCAFSCGVSSKGKVG